MNREAEAHAQYNAGQTVVHIAIAYKSHESVVAALLGTGFEVDKTDTLGRTELHEATGRGYPAIIDLLLQAGADGQAKDTRNRNPLQIAAACGWDELVGIYLRKEVAVKKPNYEAFLAGAPFRNAVAAEETSMIQRLLDTDVDVMIPDFEGRTALHHAAFHGKVELVKTLLKRGADVHARIADSAYEDRCNHEGDIAFASYQWQWVTPIHNAAGQGHASTVKILLDHGADVLAMASQHYTPLNVAASHGHAEIVRMLWEHGANIRDDAVSDDEPPNLYWAGSKGHEDVVRVMLEYGAGSEAETRWGGETLARAIEEHHIGVVKLLGEHGFSTRNN